MMESVRQNAYVSAFFFLISQQSPLPIIRGWYNRPVVAAIPKVPRQKLEKKITNLRKRAVSHKISN
jgi:hypothetical protein